MKEEIVGIGREKGVGKEFKVHYGLEDQGNEVVLNAATGWLLISTCKEK